MSISKKSYKNFSRVFLQKVFSVKNSDFHKVLTIMGVKLKFKNKKLIYKQFEYYKQCYSNIGNAGEEFVPLAEDSISVENLTKLIAFYLPQYYTFKENEEWHGRGFTEWTNVTKSIPMFTEHFQPQLPIDVGFYDLSSDKVMYRQIELAKQYGIYGFCFHYYWFSGKRLMETPIFNYLHNKELDLPFCLCWANENWSRRWDGGNQEVLMEQTLLPDDWKKFVADIAPFLQDKRYIKLGDRPVLIIYRPSLFEKDIFLDFVSKIRKEFENYGINNVYLVMAKTFGDENPPSYYGMDAAVEFPIHNMNGKKPVSNIRNFVNPNFCGIIWDIAEYINSERYIYDVDYPLFKTVFPNWDNTARRGYAGNIFQITPSLYSKWLKSCIDWTKKNNSKENQFVFINAWNEWAEGAHLEPDRRNGYAYLQATRDVLEQTSEQLTSK